MDPYAHLTARQRTHAMTAERNKLAKEKARARYEKLDRAGATSQKRGGQRQSAKDVTKETSQDAPDAPAPSGGARAVDSPNPEGGESVQDVESAMQNTTHVTPAPTDPTVNEPSSASAETE